MSKGDYLSTGQLAKSTGMTLRTLRYYDQIGLLTPEDHHSGSARKYTVKEVKRLQRIQTLKYVGLSLQEIKDILNAELISDGDIRHSLEAQLDILQKKIAHTEHIVHAIRKALEKLADGSDLDRFAELIQAVQKEENWGINIGRPPACKHESIFTTSSVRILKAGIVGFLINWK
ncbi:MerR family transcriptional regulator [Paenibacillus sp. IHB B 3084]|uniref:MerR family transcriptional regulator n=1 Tax=Paenibacillus sp. IHB B 3084 TaxID=867076 RepID=UPI000AC6824A|nr:MerR family transcriptional regulator [Paenibacillus sp. IHB B 3084]